MLTFQQIILKLQSYWDAQGCALLQPYDMEVGAGTSHTATFLRAIGPEPWKAAYVQPSRRPKDGRYGQNPNRLQHYYQYQVVLKPAPANILELYLGSLEALGFDLKVNDIRFVEDDWENPTLGCWGLGWEVWLNGMEVTQFTYFQQVGGIDCKPITGEITYGLERLAMYLQGVDNVYDLVYAPGLKYGDVFHQNEVEQSTYNFEHADVAVLLCGQALEVHRIELLEHVGDQLRLAHKAAFALQDEAVAERVEIEHPGNQHDHRQEVEGDDLARQGRAVERDDAVAFPPGLQLEVDKPIRSDPVFAENDVSSVRRFTAHDRPRCQGHSSL